MCAPDVLGSADCFKDPPPPPPPPLPINVFFLMFTVCPIKCQTSPDFHLSRVCHFRGVLTPDVCTSQNSAIQMSNSKTDFEGCLRRKKRLSNLRILARLAVKMWTHCSTVTNITVTVFPGDFIHEWKWWWLFSISAPECVTLGLLKWTFTK